MTTVQMGTLPEAEENQHIIQEDEDEEDLVVLDPNHPLMERVQAAIRDQLSKQNEKLEIELREKQETLKNAKQKREEIGVELYGVQQQLARQQMLIEKEQDSHSVMTHLRRQKEQALTDVKMVYQKMEETLKKDHDQMVTLRSDMENSAVRLKYMNEAYETIKKDIALTVRATEKAMVDISKVQKDKLQQDLYVDLLVNQVHQLEEQVALSEAQYQAQSQDTKAMKESLAEASMELEALVLEKRKLMHQWNNSLIGMRRRDEAYSAMLTARNVQQQEIRSMQTESENYKKSIIKEQERNEQLTLLLKKVESDTNHVKKQMEQIASKIENLQNEYSTYSRALHETEQALTMASAECSIKRNELNGLRTQIERETIEKRRLEDTVMEKMMQRLTMDKATQYAVKSLEKLRKRKQELEISFADIENLISKTSLQASDVNAVLKQLQLTLDDINNSIEKQNNQINKSETEINHNNALIGRKQTQIDQLNKKIKQKMSKSGGEDLGPLESKIHTLQKQITDSMEECSQMQQYWLRQQRELVKKTQTLDEQTQSISSLQKEELILSQKKLRLDGNLGAEEKQLSNIQKSIDSLQKDMVRMNTLITNKKGEQNKLQQGNILIEKDFVHSLKEAELEFLQLQATVDQLNEEKERLLNSLEESEHQIMLWERKTQLAREMKESVDSDAGQAEIKAMKAEIHRMQVRHSQLMRQQEKMIQDMEKAVYRRETIMHKSDAQVKSGKKDQTQGHYKKQITETQQKIKQIQKESSDYEQQLDELQAAQSKIVSDLHQKQEMSVKMKAELHGLELSLQEAESRKQTGTNELLSLQGKVKYLTSAKDGRYRMLHKSDENRNVEIQREKEKLQALLSVTQRLKEEGPGVLSQKLTSLSNIIKSKMQMVQLTEVLT